MALTAAQVWYITRVEPRAVTDAEAKPAYERSVTEQDERDFFARAAELLNRAYELE